MEFSHNTFLGKRKWQELEDSTSPRAKIPRLQFWSGANQAAKRIIEDSTSIRFKMPRLDSQCSVKTTVSFGQGKTDAHESTRGNIATPSRKRKRQENICPLDSFVSHKRMKLGLKKAITTVLRNLIQNSTSLRAKIPRLQSWNGYSQAPKKTMEDSTSILIMPRHDSYCDFTTPASFGQAKPNTYESTGDHNVSIETTILSPWSSSFYGRPQILSKPNRFGIKNLGKRFVQDGPFLAQGCFGSVYHCKVKMLEDGEWKWIQSVVKYNHTNGNPLDKSNEFQYSSFLLELISSKMSLREENFENEIKVLYDLQGIRGVPTLYGRIGRPQAGVVMANGGNITLRNFIQTKEYTVCQFIDIMISIAKIIQEIHGRGYCHNDLHGGNIILDENLNPTIVDYGESGINVTQRHDLFSFACNLNLPLVFFGMKMRRKTKEFEHLEWLTEKAMRRHGDVDFATFIKALDAVKRNGRTARLDHDPKGAINMQNMFI